MKANKVPKTSGRPNTKEVAAESPAAPLPPLGGGADEPGVEGGVPDGDGEVPEPEPLAVA